MYVNTVWSLYMYISTYLYICTRSLSVITKRISSITSVFVEKSEITVSALRAQFPSKGQVVKGGAYILQPQFGTYICMYVHILS